LPPRHMALLGNTLAIHNSTITQLYDSMPLRYEALRNRAFHYLNAAAPGITLALLCRTKPYLYFATHRNTIASLYPAPHLYALPLRLLSVPCMARIAWTFSNYSDMNSAGIWSSDRGVNAALVASLRLSAMASSDTRASSGTAPTHSNVGTE